MLPPDCDAATATATRIFPANHKLVGIDIGGITTSDGGAVTITITGIRQDEAVNSDDKGNPCADGTGVGTDTARVRATRVRTGNGRVYRIDFVARDSHGLECTGAVTTCVPVKKAAPCIDDGPIFDSTVPACSPTCDSLCELEAAVSAACDDEHMPGGLQHRLDVARGFVAQAAATNSPNKSIRDTMKALHILQSAARAAARAQTKGVISADCARTISDLAPALPVLPASGQ
jgi:hypothetical protein